MADVDVRGADLFTEGERIFHLFADHGQVREPLEGHLFGVARSADDAQLVERDAVAAVDVFGDGHVILRHDAFDRRDDEFVLQRYRQRLEGRFQVDGRHGQDQHVGFGNDRVDVVRKFQVVRVEMHVAQVTRIGFVLADMLQHFVVADVPADGRFVLEEDFDQRGSPAAVANYCATRLSVNFIGHNRIEIEKQI